MASSPEILSRLVLCPMAVESRLLRWQGMESFAWRLLLCRALVGLMTLRPCWERAGDAESSFICPTGGSGYSSSNYCGQLSRPDRYSYVAVSCEPLLQFDLILEDLPDGSTGSASSRVVLSASIREGTSSSKQSTARRWDQARPHSAALSSVLTILKVVATSAASFRRFHFASQLQRMAVIAEVLPPRDVQIDGNKPRGLRFRLLHMAILSSIFF